MPEENQLPEISGKQHNVWHILSAGSESRIRKTYLRFAGIAALCAPGSWLLSTFLELRGVVDLLASRLALGGLCLVGFFMVLIVTSPFLNRRNAMIASAFVSLLIAFALDSWAPKPKTQPPSAVLPNAASVQTMTPCCYLLLESVNKSGMVYAAVSNIGSEAVDNVRMQIIEELGEYKQSNEPHRVGWEGSIEVGTCRARLTISVNEQIPFDLTQTDLSYQIFILTRNESFLERITVRKKADNLYSVHYEVLHMDISRPPLVKLDAQLAVIG